VTDEDQLPEAKRSRKPMIVGVACAALALGLAAASYLSEALDPAAAFFGVGALALIAVLSLYRARLLKPSRGTIDVTSSVPLIRLGVKNAARFPTRSVLSAALVASATFVIVTVAVNRHDATETEPRFFTGNGGFRFIAETDMPLHLDQLREVNLGASRGFPLRTKVGDDASCLNLFRPSTPTLLGVPDQFIKRGGFEIQSSLARPPYEPEPLSDDWKKEQALWRELYERMAIGQWPKGGVAMPEFTDGYPNETDNPWVVLDREFPDGEIPVFGDANSVMWILHLGLGDTLEIKDSQGRPRKLLIAGLLTRSIFQSQLLMSEKNFLELFPDHDGFNTFLLQTTDATLGTQLEEQWADYGFDATTTGERLAGYLVVENTYLSTFQTLGGLGLLLGVLGLAVVMVRNVLERRGELALLQAVGFGRRAVVHLVLAENGWLLIFGVLAGTGAALLAVLPRLVAGLAHPPWGSLLLTLSAIVLTGLISGAIAVRKSMDQQLLASLRRE
jgi:hypothetical protein